MEHPMADDPILDPFAATPVQTATLGMGCFWRPEALFGQLPGVIRTRVGYAGGTTAHPTYRQLGDHTEMLQIDFDPQIIDYEAILDMFWNHHHPMNINDYKGRQYQSLLLYDTELQRETIRTTAEKRETLGQGRPGTEIAPLSAFFLAEERHQKHELKRYPDAMKKLETLYPSPEALMDGTLAARLNGLAKGFTNLSAIIEELRQWPLPKSEQDRLVALLRQIRW